MNNKRRLLIVGASRFQRPAIEKAKELGLYVGVVDVNPRAEGVSLADQYYQVSTNDMFGVYKVADQFAADGVMTLATDMPIRSVAYACERLGLPGISFETAVRATDKWEMIKVLERKKVPVPWFVMLEDRQKLGDHSESLSYPLICKPSDNSGGRGVIFVSERQALESAIAYSATQSRNGRVLIEEYLEGPEVSCEMIVVDKNPFVLQITDKYTSGTPYFVELGHSQGSRLSSETRALIESIACKAAIALGIDHGAVHAEIKITNNGPKVVEIGARMGGGYVATHLVQLSTGIDMTKAVIQQSLGDIPDLKYCKQYSSAIWFITLKPGTVMGIEGVDEALNVSGVKKAEIWIKPGDKIGSMRSGMDRYGCVIASSDCPKSSLEICEEAISRIKIVIT